MKSIRYWILMGCITCVILISGCRSNEEKAEEALRNGIHCLWSEHNNEKARENFERYLELVPNDARGYYYIGVCEMNSREYVKALEQFNKAIDMDANYADAHYNKGQCYLLLDNKDEACKAFYEAQAKGKESMEDKIFDCERYYEYMKSK